MKKIILCFLTVMTAVAANAESFSQSPSAWILESYDTNGVIFSRTPATCTNGRLILPGSSSVADRNRLFGIVMSAKMSGLKISITYSVSGSSCIVTKFGSEN